MGAFAAGVAAIDRAKIAIIAARHAARRESILEHDPCAGPAHVDVARHECPGSNDPGSHGQRPIGNQDECGHHIAGAKRRGVAPNDPVVPFCPETSMWTSRAVSVVPDAAPMKLPDEVLKRPATRSWTEPRAWTCAPVPTVRLAMSY
jgi:hypothetical protein